VIPPSIIKFVSGPEKYLPNGSGLFDRNIYSSTVVSVAQHDNYVICNCLPPILGPLRNSRVDRVGRVSVFTQKDEQCKKLKQLSLG
jgi:hypothetical protein